MKIFWDEPKRQANLEKHAMDFALLSEEFFDDALTGEGKLGRWIAVGLFDDRIIAVIFVRLGQEAVSVVSMRPASQIERKRYDAEGI